VEPVAGKSVCPGIRQEKPAGYRDRIEDAAKFVVSHGTDECSTLNYILCKRQKALSDSGEHILSSFKAVQGLCAETQVSVQESVVYAGCDGDRPLFINVSVGEVQEAEGSVEDTHAFRSSGDNPLIYGGNGCQAA